jgi:hypothetical protein
MTNDHLILVSGKSATGKSASLMDMINPEGVIYLNCENGKKLPFKAKFKELTIVDTNQIYQAFEEAEKLADVHTIVIDTLTYMMDLYESTKVLTADPKLTMQAWGGYSQYFKLLMSQCVARSSKNVIFLGHTADIMNESEMVKESIVKVKGSLMNNGIESYFTNVISTKKLALSKFTDVNANSPLFAITEEDKINGFKYVFQTRLTKDTINERIRAPMGMWSMTETYIDNNLQNVVNRLHEYYK